MELEIKNRNFSNEFIFSATRSSGAGGQNVNKVNTRVELRFNIGLSDLLTDEEKNILFEKLANKIKSSGELIIVSQKERSQLKNKENTIEKFYILLEKALKKKSLRKATKPSKSAVEKRLTEKKNNSEKKSLRRKID